MADIAMNPGTTGYSTYGDKPVVYKIEAELDFADALTAKGSALAAADIVQLIDLPKGAVAFGAGVEVITAADSTTLTLDVGTAVDADAFVDGFDGKSAAGTVSQFPAAYQPLAAVAADTLDVTFATLTGTLTSGKVRVWVVLVDTRDVPNPGIAKIGS